jgi:hypothetical protein
MLLVCGDDQDWVAMYDDSTGAKQRDLCVIVQTLGSHVQWVQGHGDRGVVWQYRGGSCSSCVLLFKYW